MPANIRTGSIGTPQARAVLCKLAGLSVDRAAGLGQTETSDWDKFIQFNNSIAPVISNIFGTWLSSRADAYSAQQMATAMKSMSPEERTYIMQGYLAQQMLGQQGYNVSGYNNQNLGVAFQYMDSGMVNSMYSGASQNLLAAAGGNAQVQAFLNKQGIQIGATGGLNMSVILPIGIGVAVLAVVLLSQKKS